MELTNTRQITIPNKENPFEFLCMKLPECNISDVRLNFWIESKFNNVLRNDTMASLNFDDIMTLYASIEAYDICYDHGYLIDNVFDIVCESSVGSNIINIALEYHLGCDYINMVFIDEGIVHGTFKIHFGVEIWNVLSNMQYLISQYDISGGRGDEMIDSLTLLFEQGAYVNNIGELYRKYLKDSEVDVYD